MKPTRMELAFHEAGHAYAYASLVWLSEPLELGVAKDEAGNDHGWCRRNTLLHTEITLSRVSADARPGIEWNAAAEIVIAMAGSVAEFRRRYQSRVAGGLVICNNLELFLKPGVFDVDGDFERVRRSMSYIEPPDPHATLLRLTYVTDEIVAQNWQSILHLGRRLLDVGTMGEDELIMWFEERPAKRHTENLSMA